METQSINILKQIAHDVRFLKNEMVEIKEDICGLKDIEFEVKSGYLEKLDKIENGKFLSREEFEKEIAD